MTTTTTIRTTTKNKEKKKKKKNNDDDDNSEQDSRDENLQPITSNAIASVSSAILEKSGSSQSSNSRESMVQRNRDDQSVSIQRENTRETFDRVTPETESQPSLHKIGGIVLSSSDGQNLGLDWALCKLTTEIKDIPLSLAVGRRISAPKDRKRSHHEQTVDILTPRSTIKGTIRPIQRCWKPPGESDFTEVFPIRLDQPIELGQSGSWAIGTESGEWLGHVIATRLSQQLAYITSANKILNDIELKCSSAVTLPASPK